MCIFDIEVVLVLGLVIVGVSTMIDCNLLK